MKTYSLNALAEQFEVDRGTMVKALRDVLPDAEGTPNRPTWKTSTAARALEAHRNRSGRAGSHRTRRSNVNIHWQDPVLVSLYSEQDAADQALRKLKAIPERRAAAVAMIPLINRVDQASRERAKANGQDADAADMRADHLFQLQLRGLEAPCQWTHEETWAAMNKEV